VVRSWGEVINTERTAIKIFTNSIDNNYISIYYMFVRYISNRYMNQRSDKMLDYIILGFLMGREMSGYDIKQYMSISTSNFIDASFGSIYPALKKLEEKGKIISNEIIDNGKYKKIYKITDIGTEFFLDWLNKPIEVEKAKQTHLAKIFFYRFLPVEKVEELLVDFIERYTLLITEIEDVERKVKDYADNFHMSTLYFGKSHYKLVINWCEKLLEDIGNKK